MLLLNNDSEYTPPETTGASDPLVPDHASYLIAANAHQEANTGTSIFDPSTWGDRADAGLKFSVSTLTRAVSSTYNAAITVGKLAGVATDADKVSTQDWLSSMDDDLGKYYQANQESVDTWGDVVGMIVPGTAGVKVLNWAQRGVELATAGKAGLNLAHSFGTLPNKAEKFAKMAAADMADTGNTFTLINANIAKSFAAGVGQSYLEVAAFDVAAESTMRDSPLFKDHDAGDIAYNALMAGGFIGGGLLGVASLAHTIVAAKRAGNAVDAAIKPHATVDLEPMEGTPASERVAIHLNNRSTLPTVEAGEELAAQKSKALDNTQRQELNNGRTAMHELTGGDKELANHSFDMLATYDAVDVSAKLAGVTSISRAGIADANDATVAIAKLESAAERSANKLEAASNKLASKSVGTSDYAEAATNFELAKTGHEAALESLATARARPAATDFMKLTGADAGTIYSEIPTLRLADKVEDVAELNKVIAKFKHSQSNTAFSVASKLAAIGEDGIEARQIVAHTGEFDITKPVGVLDLPYLERAWAELGIGNGKTVRLSDGQELTRSDLYHHILDVKAKTADDLVAQSELAGTTPLNQATLAKLINTSEDYVVGTRNVRDPIADIFRMQNDAIQFTKAQIAQGLWQEAKGTIPTWAKPSLVRMNRDTSKAAAITGHEVDGMAALREEQALYRQTADNVFNNFNPKWAAKYADRIPAAILLTANRASVGRGLLNGMNGDYKTLASFAQQMGATTAAWKAETLKNIADEFTPAGHALLNDAEAGTEFWKTVQQLRMTPEKYRMVENYAAEDGSVGLHLVNIKQLDWEAAGADKAKLPQFEDAAAPVAIPLTTDGMQQWARTWNESRQAEQTHRANLRASQGVPFSQSNLTNFYVPPVDPRRYPHYALVVDDSLTSTGHVSMIHANTAADLEALVAKVPTEQGLRVIHKDQSEAYFKAYGSYEYNLGINDNYIDTALKRSGAAAPFQPVTDPKVLWEEVMNWRQKQATGLINEMVSHKYAPEFAELRRQGELYDLANTSVKGYVDKWRQARTTNPYTDYIATALYNEPSGGAPIWDAVNRLAETSVATVSAKLQDTWKDVITPADLAKVNEHLESIGCKAYTDAATYMLANHTAPKPVLSGFVRSMNSMLTTLMLRTDPMNAVNNGLGHSVLYFAEMRKLVESLEDGGKITVPGTANSILSPTKLAASAYGEFFRNVIGREDKGALYTECAQLNLLPSYTAQFAQIMDAGTLTGKELAADLHTKVDTALAATKQILGTGANKLEAVSGNRLAEEMNRFVSGVTAIRACDAAIAAGKLDPVLKPSIVNTFVNRVEGITLAKQRPLMFRGAVGQAVGLFQTYQFNMLQQLFRHVGEGDFKTTGLLLGLQGSIYGMNGLPAFNAMNQYLVGNAAGNVTHSDVVTAAYGAAGKEAGDWLLYGAASNMLIHPDAKINLYSRGDINPRQVTVIPTSLADVPIVGATAKLFNSMSGAIHQMDKGADKWNAFIQGVQHSGISRPLTGFAQVLEGVTSGNGAVTVTDNGNNIVMQNELFSIMSASRLLGAKPLDEAVAMDAFHRVQTYQAASRAQIDNLGAGIKATVAGGGTPTQDQIDTFIAEYVKAGGKQQQFSKFYSRQILDAQKSKVNLMIDSSNSNNSQYMQRIMGGYSLADYVNSTRTGVQDVVDGGKNE